jgi:hypothetical protein
MTQIRSNQKKSVSSVFIRGKVFVLFWLIANCQLLIAHLKCIAASLSFSLPSLRLAFSGTPYFGWTEWQVPSQ